MVRPRCGLLIPDWATGGSLQLTGSATVSYTAESFGAGAQGGVEFTVEQVVELTAATTLRWGPPELSPANP
ncbi:hypothetical protein [Nocardia brevicatena]|uniref:hypothetical protein n=1 Tax=Nocardia brevicatena TaxID=37327 RepID=UPI0002DDA957|nr:hypothetical protein [Nocardia brevicatena]